MTDIEQEARAEAERRYADRYEPRLAPGAVRNARREAFERGAVWAASRPASSATREAVVLYCPIHGDLLAGNRSLRCAEAAPGHEFARPAPATREAVARVVSQAVGGWNPETRAITSVADALLSAFTITEKGAE